MTLILKKKYENLTIVNLEKGISFVHNNKSNKNYFSNKMIAQACGTNESNVRRYWSNFKDKRSNVSNSHVSLMVVNSDKPVDFKGFDFFNYVSNRVNTKEALQMQEYISNAIDDKFNKDVGFTTPIIDKLANAMHLDKIELLERNNELESQVKNLAKRIGEERALKEEVEHLKKEDLRNKIEIADLYSQISNLKGNYYRRKLKELETSVNNTLDKWMVEL